ncbi:MAG: hypothetical protein WCE93_09350, partial [Nitrososphaeraceae archaeon]
VFSDTLLSYSNPKSCKLYPVRAQNEVSEFIVWTQAHSSPINTMVLNLPVAGCSAFNLADLLHSQNLSSGLMRSNFSIDDRLWL